MAYNYDEPVLMTISATGRYYIQLAPFGAATLHILTVSGLTFTVECTMDQTNFASARYAVNDTLQTLGDACTPNALDVIDITPGLFKWICINVSAGTGTGKSMVGNGNKNL